MSEDWLVDVRKYAADADEGVVAAIVRYCGIALRNRDSSLVSMSDPTETGRVRENFLKKKLGLDHADDHLDAAIVTVGQRMGGDPTKNRVTVYYLLTEHFDRFELFGGTPRGGAGLAAAGGAMGLAAATPAAATTAPTAGDPPPARPSPESAPVAPVPLAAPMPHGARMRPGGNDAGFFGTAALVATLAIGAILVASLVAIAVDQPAAAPAVAAPAAPVAAAPVAPAAPTIPDGAGVVAATRDEKPMLTVYFDTGKSDVSPDFAAAAGPVMAWLEANPGATLAISGFNDPTGNAAANERLSRSRAQAVQAALVAEGVAEERTDLVKPDETTRSELSNAEARRVEVTIVDG